MRFRHADGSTVHLSYCTNVHAAEDLDGVIAQLDRFAGPIRQQLDWTTLGVGLWLAAPVATQLANDARLVEELKQALDRRHLEVVTLNGFPYQAFQSDIVKGAVYRPNWAEPERLQFTLNIASILHRLLPDDVVAGSVSTLPLGWRDVDTKAARGGLEKLAEGLQTLAQQYGRPVRVALEPEPGCVVETIDEAIDVLGDLAPEWIGLCLDACHLAVQFEDATDAVARLAKAGVPIVKSQISNALRVPDPLDADWLNDFVEPRFLHQTRQQRNDEVHGVDDLDQAFDELDIHSEWRVHFHVPIHVGGERTTQQELHQTLVALEGGAAPATHHLEVETYTWSVLPPGLRPTNDAGLIDGLARELAWVSEQLIDLGLQPQGAS
jgi:hypothetical protein